MLAKGYFIGATHQPHVLQGTLIHTQILHVLQGTTHAHISHIFSLVCCQKKGAPIECSVFYD